jgi:hypothetical protein
MVKQISTDPTSPGFSSAGDAFVSRPPRDPRPWALVRGLDRQARHTRGGGRGPCGSGGGRTQHLLHSEQARQSDRTIDCHWNLPVNIPQAQDSNAEFHRVGPACSSWPCILTGNPYQRPEVGPKFWAIPANFTLRIWACAGFAADDVEHGRTVASVLQGRQGRQRSRGDAGARRPLQLADGSGPGRPVWRRGRTAGAELSRGNGSKRAVATPRG